MLFRSDHLSTWNNASVGEPTLLVWSYTVDSIPTDVYQIDRVEIFKGSPLINPSLSPMGVITSLQINHIGTGMYQFVSPAQAEQGEFYHKITFVAVAGSAPAFDLKILVVNSTQNTTTWKTSSEAAEALRMMLNDSDPDSDYHFSPPSMPTVSFAAKKNKKQYVWTDKELDLCLWLGSKRLASVPPITPGQGFSYYFSQQTHWLLYASLIEALRMKAILWINEEFDYNVGSLSMSLTKYDKYNAVLTQMEANLIEQYTAVKASANLHSRGIYMPSSTYGRGGRNSISRVAPGHSVLRTRF